ncbi:Protein sip5 [Lachnellula hyalina]|uniref:Protein sip5 n=1 Tax=Lachnellula hyalina TaxID=1316788 RepID=A0A8H8U1T4_9HELO|nr:Protein sip5 [Lachnellula hyalina]TVY27371.1 Protein sip5 [Lachnellula hyalina]
MGNNSTKESRGPDSASSNRRPDSAGGTSGPTSPTGRHHSHPYSSRSGRGSRPDLSFLGISNLSNEAPERRETKQEREARRLEKERVARIKERERSLQEENVDGGYLVTLGVYSGPEDFNKSIVRQLMIERRIAPFFRGVEDFSKEWAEHQIVAVARGLPLPPADEIPPELRNALSPESPNASNPNIQNLTVPITSRSQSAGSDTSALSPSHPAFAPSSPGSPVASSPPQSSSPFRPRSKTLASLTTSSKNPSPAEITPREIQLPKDAFVNGQPIEVFLYKDAIECSICFLDYPPWLNRTRCCDQSICSECFVQIKRLDPHPPEHADPSQPAPIPAPSESVPEPETLVSEPARCPYCQAPNFGVTYTPPPFRRGVAYANSIGVNNLSSAMSSSSSLASTGAPAQAFNTHKRRTTSVSADAPTVVTIDKIRPDWATKLSSARSHQQRRSAAATALHTAAYLIGNGNTESRGFGFTSRRTFGRHRGGDSPAASGSATPSTAVQDQVGQEASDEASQSRAGGSSRRRNRMEDLEDMMMMEAIRLSLAAEDERKRKNDKEAAKEAKKKAKEEKKKEKKEKKIYGSGPSSASGSTLSLSTLGLGRRRGNSGASNLAREVTPENVEPSDPKGKGVDRGVSSTATTASMGVSQGESSTSHSFPGVRLVDTSNLPSNESYQPVPSPTTAPDRPSHLRQMSNASSPASSFMDSVPNSLHNGQHRDGSSSTLESPNASGTNVAGYSAGTPDTGDESGGAGIEPIFNFTSLAAMISSEDTKNSSTHIEHIESGPSSSDNARENASTGLESSIATLKVDNPAKEGTQEARQTTLLHSQTATPVQTPTPEVMITPETPSGTHDDDDGKQLGSGWRSDEVVSSVVTQ